MTSLRLRTLMDGRVEAFARRWARRPSVIRRFVRMPRSSPRGFYGPFREAADSAAAIRRPGSYQMDGANVREAMREIEADIERAPT